MKTYRVTLFWNSAYVEREYKVMAESTVSALQKVKQGQAECIHEHVEPDGEGDPEIEEIS